MLLHPQFAGPTRPAGEVTMDQRTRRKVWKLAERLLPPEEVERARGLPFCDLGYGYDLFGMERESAVLSYLFLRLLHKHWFRVESIGIHHVPTEGPALVVPNHSGILPLDAAMLATDVFVKLEKPRIVRTVVDFFASALPFVNVFLSRAGQVIGHPKNFESLLRAGELVGVFPEGARGTGKPFSERYRLRRFNVGFVELALRHRVPILPVAIIGAEEQAPMLMNLSPVARLLGFPYFPITPTFPFLGPLGIMALPSKYCIYYDEPFRFFEEYPPEAADDAHTVRILADKVQVRIQEMIDAGLERRTSVFGLGAAEEFVWRWLDDER
jgi:1-acyl-sn-glycerol-3-phosphate acyltransferase